MKQVTHFGELNFGPHEFEQFRTFYKLNWEQYGYEGPEAYIQATIDILRVNGYTVEKETEDVTGRSE